MIRTLLILTMVLMIGGGVAVAQQAPRLSSSSSAATKSVDPPGKALLLFMAAVAQHDYETARKFLPRDIVKMVENNMEGGFEAFIKEIDKEYSQNKLVIHDEKIEGNKATVETVTLTPEGKRIEEKWFLRMEDDLWKLDIFQPR